MNKDLIKLFIETDNSLIICMRDPRKWWKRKKINKDKMYVEVWCQNERTIFIIKRKIRFCDFYNIIEKISNTNIKYYICKKQIENKRYVDFHKDREINFDINIYWQDNKITEETWESFNKQVSDMNIVSITYQYIS